MLTDHCGESGPLALTSTHLSLSNAHSALSTDHSQVS